jgi:4-hydroxy-tetrahydrodipicolinate reductase
MPIQVLVSGAAGKMGQEVVKAIQQNPEFSLAAQAGKHDDLNTLIQQSGAEVVVDFTTPDTVFKNTLTIIRNQIHPVIGTTGLQETQLAELTHLCAEKKLGGIIAPNFSLSAILMMQFAGIAARFFPHAEIIELHHPNKIDSPSGTAIKTAAIIAENRQQTIMLKPTRETLPGARGAVNHDIPIHAIRLPGFSASQEVIFGGLGQTLAIRQDTVNREAYMPGVLLACKKVKELDHLVYGLESFVTQFFN